MIHLSKLPDRGWNNSDIDCVSQIDDMAWRILSYYWSCWE